MKTQTQPTILIRNKNFLISELENNRTQKVFDLLNEYMKDPNCFPDLYCKDSELNEWEQAAFIQLAVNFNKYYNA